MDLLFEPLGHAFFVRALVAASLVGLVCAVVGTFVVLKGLAFIGDAVSHAAFPGVVVAYIVSGPILVGAAIAAVGTALAIGFVTRRATKRPIPQATTSATNPPASMTRWISAYDDVTAVSGRATRMTPTARPPSTMGTAT